jgi:sirohydrochlorin cobaltochelatase
MPDSISALLDDLLRADFILGQVCITPTFEIHHADDAPDSELEVFRNPNDAVEIARYDDSGNYRPLKTEPNLRRGWKLALTNAAEIRLALDFLYPSALGTWLEHIQSELTPVSLRETLARQSGMYAIVRKLTDEQADEVIQSRCNPETGCIRKILWTLDDTRSSPFTVDPGTLASFDRKQIPILCPEACNLLVAAGREKIKSAG